MRHRHISCILTLALLGSFLMPSNQRATAQTAPAPAKETTLPITGLKGRVLVRRDERGIPHIEAASEDDLYFAQGYVTARDRLWQMDLLRRTARGELSELFGQLTLEDDKRRRTYGFTRVAEASLATVSQPARAALEAYARGVNAYIASLDGSGEDRKLPVEFTLLQYQPRPWTPLDSLVLGKNFAEVLSTTWPVDLMRAMLADLPVEKRQLLLPSASPLDVIVVGSARAARKKAARFTPALPASEAARSALWRELAAVTESINRTRELFGHAAPGLDASNNWVVSGARTVTGKPLLANDPHLTPSAPSIWHMVHLAAPGLHVAGVTAPGLAGVIIGHNEHIAWGVTNLGPDVQDLYLEKFSADNRTYLTAAGPRAAEIRREEIKVRKNLTNPATEVVVHEVTVTRHGPVILERDGARYALRWTALDPSGNEMEAFYNLNRASDWKEFLAALKNYKGATQNFVYADTAGHIGYYGAGVIPIRRSGDGSVPYDGSTDAGEWTSYIPFEKLPHVYDPPSGMIVTANSRIVGRDYPYHLTHLWAAPFRSRRIHELLQATPKHTADSFRRIQGDTHSIGGQMFARGVAQAAGKIAPPTGDGERERQSNQFSDALAQFEKWDGHLNADSPVGPLLAEMFSAFRLRVLTHAIGPERTRQYSWDAQGLWIDQLLTERPTAWLPKEFDSYGELLLTCYRDAREALTKRLGADEAQWTWGRYTQARFPHPLAAVPFVGGQFVVTPFPQNGAGGRPGATVNVGSGVSMRLIADPSDWDQTQQGIALGESGDPKSAHWNDQLADWRAVTPRLLPFSKAAVNAAARQTLMLMPATAR